MGKIHIIEKFSYIGLEIQKYSGGNMWPFKWRKWLLLKPKVVTISKYFGYEGVLTSLFVLSLLAIYCIKGSEIREKKG